jgi:hypothetical protein
MTRHVAGAVLCVALVQPAPAAEPAAPRVAAAAQTRYDAEIGDLLEKYSREATDAQAEYADKLDELIEAETDRGDLDRLLMLRAERKRLESGDLADTAEPEEKTAPPRYVLLLRGSYASKMRAARAVYERAAKGVHADFLDDLEKLVREETQAGRIESAVAVRDWRAGFEKAGPPAPRIVEPDPGPFGWEAAVASPAKIRIPDITAVPFDPASKAFKSVPQKFAEHPAEVYTKFKDKYKGVADVTVLDSGWLFVGCHYGYQGEAGSWAKQRWTEQDFVKNGWQRLSKDEVGGPFVMASGREQVVFVKFVRAQEQMKLRCNKYDPPFVILFAANDDN